MRYRKLTATGDYTIGTGGDFLVNSPAAVAQAVKTRLLLNAGEWYLDSTQGMPWLTAVMGKYTQRGCDSVIKAYILDTPGVDSILSYSSVLNHTTRALSVTVTLSTIYGAATVAAVVAF